MRSPLTLGLIVTAAVTSLVFADAPRGGTVPSAGPPPRATSDPPARLVVFEEFSRPT
jgi:hypothetical protein